MNTEERLQYVLRELPLREQGISVGEVGGRPALFHGSARQVLPELPEGTRIVDIVRKVRSVRDQLLAQAAP